MNKQKRIKYTKVRGDKYREMSMHYASGEPLLAATVKPSKGMRREQDCIRRASTEKLQRANQLRRNMTPAEVHLWKVLKRIGGFSPQPVVYGYIPDFCHFQTKLIIEVDGPVHLNRWQYDRERDGNLFKTGYRTVRFTNDEVLNNRTVVLGTIMEAL